MFWVGTDFAGSVGLQKTNILFWPDQLVHLFFSEITNFAYVDPQDFINLLNSHQICYGECTYLSQVLDFH